MSVDWGPYQCDMNVIPSASVVVNEKNCVVTTLYEANAEGDGKTLDVTSGPYPKDNNSIVAIDARGWRRQKQHNLLQNATPPLVGSGSSSSRWSSSCSLVFCAYILALLFGGVTAQLSPHTHIQTTQSNIGVCKNVDIRNSLSAFDQLKGCRVVEGYVQILLMDTNGPKDEIKINELQFPDLREITGYLLLFRVQGLRSLRTLFPNLAVIRGHSLLFNYALVIYEMRHLQEISLVSLTHILRGSVRIEKNPQLCYVETVDWDLIAQMGKEEHFITENKRRNECPICPSGKHSCPKSPNTNEHVCWNRQHCQKVCPESCGSRSCQEDGRCCDELCLGGCTSDGSASCYVCRNVVLKNQCITHCPYGTYEYLNRRCVEEAECRNMTVVTESADFVKAKQWKPFNHTCILECPINHVEVPIVPSNEALGYTCERCNGSCRKECNAANVNSIASAQKLRGCTYIKGALEIQIRGGKNIVKELEESLSLIEEIEGYLKIVRSFPLISLNFLKNLTIIHGKSLDNHKHAFIVRDNQNLQELWNWTTRREEFHIKRGKLFFHFNPKLCLYKIQKLREVANLPAFTDSEVARDSNGDKISCNVKELEAWVQQKTSSAVVIEWQAFTHHDARALLGYIVYYIEAPSQNITLYDGRDACGGDGWLVAEVSVETYDKVPDEAHNVSYILTQLKPYTQYAFYVKTDTIATEGTGALSPLQYFRTLPGVPSVPWSLKAYSNSSSEIVVQWLPPAEANGNITHYMVEASWTKGDPEFLEQRDYCAQPALTIPPKASDHAEKKSPLLPSIDPDEKSLVTLKSPESPSDEKGTCACDEKDKKPTQMKEKEIQLQILFENYLHNTVYVKSQGPPPINQGPAKKKRDITMMDGADPNYDRNRMNYPEFPSDTTQKEGHVTPQTPAANQEKMVEGKYHNYRQRVQGTMVVIKPLQHFAEYTIYVSACRERDPEEDLNSIVCSKTSMITSRTLKLESADNLNDQKLTVDITNHTEVKLKWEEPSEPNEIIVTYNIEYQRVGVEKYSLTECITRKQFIQFDKTYTLKNLNPGNYSFRLRATSLAGTGEWTPYKNFLIQDSSSNSNLPTWLIVIIAIGAVIVIALAIYMGLQHRKRLNLVDMTLFATVNPEYVSTVYTPDEWEVPRKKIELIKELGQGSFGMVYEGIARDMNGKTEIRCAVKTVGANASDREKVEFLKEASVMKAFKTNHVVRLLGVVSQCNPNQAALVVMELMAYGDLKSYLRSHRPSENNDEALQPPTLKRILQMAIEIADGMAYLSAKKFVHRDLAARNCMVADDLTVKIGDFGMTRDIYETDYYRKDTKGLLPVRWMAPESLKDGMFTSFSDVWSYGVVLWEMATLASQPYQGLSNDQVLRYVIEGGVMEPPEKCPKKLYELMSLCWLNRPQMRPSFMELVYRLLGDVGPAFSQVSFFHTEAEKDARESARIAAAARAIKSASPPLVLRVAHDIEDFSLGSGSEDQESDEDVGEAAALTSHSSVKTYNSSTRPNNLAEHPMPPTAPSLTVVESPNAPPVISVYSSDSSRGSKVSNGSTANGYLSNHVNSGPNNMKTTEC